MRHRPPQGSSSSSTSTSTSTATSLLSLSLALLSLLPSAIAADSVPQIPPIDFDALGALGVSGSFAGLQLWSPDVSSNNRTTAFLPSSSTLLSRLPNGTLSRIGSTEADGTINSICQLNSPNNSGRRVFVGGKFDKIIGKGVSNVFSYDPGNQQFDDLLGGLDGQVDSIFCDSEKNSIIFGGSFKTPVNPGEDPLISSRYLGSIAGWNETSKNWFPLQFGGLNGSISFIGAGTNSSNLRFGGAFDVEFSANQGSNPNNQLNASAISGTNTSSSALTSALTPLSLGQSEFTGGPPLNLMGFDDPAQILCPQGPDGPDSSYLFADGAVGRLTVRTFRPLEVRAIRLGNTFYEGRGTKTFGLVSIPDNTPLQLTYLDPVTDRNMTCTNNCTLTDQASIPYQDFLISQAESNGAVNGTKVLTGIEFTAYDHYGQGAGLHILELLSEGAWAYAYGGYNRGSCSSNQPGVNGTVSTSTSQGGWYQSAVTVNNAVGGTIEAVMSLTDDYSNLQANVGSSLTWNVDVPVNGNYSVYMFIPGCQALNECGMRTSVDVITKSNSTSPGNTTRISQVVQQDTSVLVYDGEISKTSQGFNPSVTLTIPADMPAPADGNRFTIIADKVSFLLRNSNETFQGAKAKGFGVFEFDQFDPLSSINVKGAVNGTGTLPNSTISDLSRFSISLLNHGIRGNESERIFTIHDCAKQTFVGGNFTSDAYNASAFNGTVGNKALPPNAFANLVYYNATTAGNNVSVLPGGGLNSVVYALTSVRDLLYIGGNFTSTLDDSVILNYFAIYDPVKFEWTPIQDGPTGPVKSLVALPDGSILVSGDFDSVNATGQVGGFTVFDPVKRTWANQPELLVASINAASGPAPDGDSNAESWLAGKVIALSQSKTSGGGADLSENSKTNQVEINGLNFAFKGSMADGTSPKENQSANGLIGTFRRDSSPLVDQVGGKVSSFGNWFNKAKSALPPISPDDNSRYSSSKSNKLSAQRSIDQILNKRQGSSTSIASLEPASLLANGANQLLASAYWAKPGVNDVKDYPRIVGGNFTTTTGIKNIGYYDPTADGNAGALTALPTFPNEPGMNLTLIRSLLVVGNILYVGGDGGLVTMDLSATPLMWRTGSDSPAALEADDGEELRIISMVHRPDTETVVVAGTFQSAANLPCMGLCAWDQGLMRWASLRNGVQGQVEALDYANRDASLVIVAGQLSVNGVSTSLASYDFVNQIWTPLGSVGAGNGQIPGPATAVSVDDLNADAIFVAGRDSAGSAPFLVKWDGTSYQPVGGNELQSTSGISQLTFFPISQAHASNSVLEPNRVLVVSGALFTNSFGNLSSALFDGENWIPFLISTTNNGMSGIIRGLTRSTEVIRYPNLHRLAVGIVILISIALGLGVVFLLVLIGLVWALARRRSEPKAVVPMSHSSQETLSDEDMAAMGGMGAGAKKRPSSLLATLNAATENVVSMSHPSGGTEGSGMVSYGNVAPAAAGGVAAAAAMHNQHNRHESTGQPTTLGHGSTGQPTTLGHSDETGPSDPSTAYHSEAMTGRTGEYYSGNEDGTYDDAYDQGAGDVAAGAAAAGVGELSRGIPAHARYSFEATHESELGVRAGQSLEILDDGDEHWWLIMDENGRRGVVPATYIL